MKKIKKNMLDFIPQKNEKYKCINNQDGTIQIHIMRDSWFENLVRFFAKTPKMMKIDLDEYGSKVWNEIDGEKTIYEIGENIKAEFGDKIEPLYPRLGHYMRILENNHFIVIRRK